jgi:hypothetical protein
MVSLTLVYLQDSNPVAPKEFCQVAVLRNAPSNFVDIHLFLRVICNGEIPVANVSHRKSRTAPGVWLINCTFLRQRNFGYLSLDSRVCRPYLLTYVLTYLLTYLLIYSVTLVRKRTIPTELPPLVGELIANFCDRGCHVVSMTDPYGRILGFLDRSRYFSIK